MPKRPNVLLILQDQLRYDCVDTSLASTPAFDRLRADGLWFERAYTPIAICSPARASLFTSLYPHTHGVLNNVHGTDAVSRNLPRELPQLGELMQAAGYRTGYVGKWHVAMDDQPTARGFADYPFGDGAFFTEGDRRGEAYRKLWLDPNARVSTRYPATSGDHPRVPFPMYVTEPADPALIPATVTCEGALGLLEAYRGSDEPWFLVVSFVEPHWPNAVPEPFHSMYDPADSKPWANFDDTFANKPRANEAGLEHFGVRDFTWEDWQGVVARYLGAVSFIDDLMGKLVDAAGDDTLIISTADHGDMTGSHRQFNKGPLMYEETYRIPFVVRGPGIRAGERTDAYVSLLDIMPTTLDYAGVDAPERMHGTSLRPVLEGNETGWRDALMCEFHGDEFGLYTQRMIRTANYKLVYNPNDLRELYDLASDPAELHNLAYEPEYADVRRQLEVRLLDLMFDTEDSHRQWAVNCLG